MRKLGPKKIYVVFCEIINKKIIEINIGSKNYKKYFFDFIQALRSSKKFNEIVEKDDHNFYLSFSADKNKIEILKSIDRTALKMSNAYNLPLFVIYKGASLENDHQKLDRAIYSLSIGIMTRRNIIIYQPAIKNAYDEKQLIKKKITDAIINKKFIILYQLKVNYCTKKVTGIEALLRLRKNDSDFFNT